MHARALLKIAPFVLATLIMLGTASCATAPVGPVVVLPNGYYLKPDNTNQSEIVKRGAGSVLEDPVAAYAVSGYIVAGAVGSAPSGSRQYSDLAFTGAADTRYFILDTASGKLESNLDGTEWQKRLKDLGVPSDFQIYPPLPWQS
jgi:hypothetical protein